LIFSYFTVPEFIYINDKEKFPLYCQPAPILIFFSPCAIYINREFLSLLLNRYIIFKALFHAFLKERQTDTKKLGKKIKLARIELDLTQTQLAEKINGKQKSISGLVCVRYRYDLKNKQKLTTVEIIIDRQKWTKDQSRTPPNKIINLRIDYGERELAQQVKSLGGRWDNQKKTWKLPFKYVQILRLEDRIIKQ